MTQAERDKPLPLLRRLVVPIFLEITQLTRLSQRFRKRHVQLVIERLDFGNQFCADGLEHGSNLSTGAGLVDDG